jgi:tRNA 2-thiouridine synthesizing protein C
MKQSILLLSSAAPYGITTALETLDLIFAAGSLFNKVSVLFLGDGIYALLRSQDPTQIQNESLGAQLASLPHYDVTPIYVHMNDLATRGLAVDDLVLPATLVTDQDIKQLVATYEMVISL